MVGVPPMLDTVATERLTTGRHMCQRPFVLGNGLAAVLLAAPDFVINGADGNIERPSLCVDGRDRRATPFRPLRPRA